MPTEPVWPVANTRAAARHCTGLGSNGGSSRGRVWDEEALLHALRGNRAAAARVIRAFVDDCPRVTRALIDALQAEDRVAIQHLAHRLKGNAAILRAPAVDREASRLEEIAESGDLAQAKEHLETLDLCLKTLCDALGRFLEVPGAATPP